MAFLGTQRDNVNPIALEGFRALQASPLGVSVTIAMHALLTASRDPTVEPVEISYQHLRIAPQRNLTNQGCK